MIAVLPTGVGLRLWGVVVGLGLICGLVAGRQLAAFHDNTRLIEKLDTTLADLREHEARLRHQALFDGLTGLANRTHFHEQVAAALAASAETPGTVSLLLIDLDGFKSVNDTLGHAVGVASAEHGDDVESLLRDADMAMYAAKHDGKGTWMRYDTSMEPAAR